MSEWKAHVHDNWEHAGLDIVWVRDLPDGREISNGTTGWYVSRDGSAAIHPNAQPLRLREEMGRALLAALLQHFSGADDARMLRQDYDAERARVDRLIGHLIAPASDPATRSAAPSSRGDSGEAGR